MFSKKGILCRCKVTHFPKIMALCKQFLHKKNTAPLSPSNAVKPMFN